MNGNFLSGDKEKIEKDLSDLPDQVATAMENWNLKKLEREKTEALLHMGFKARNREMTVADIKAAINSDEKRYLAMVEEIKSEAQYNRLYEQLMSAKKLASLRTAF